MTGNQYQCYKGIIREAINTRRKDKGGGRGVETERKT